jgi:hypothetical protein
MIPILHNTLLATPKLKFYSGAFANFWGPLNPATTIFMEPNSNCTLGNTRMSFWGVSQTQILLRGLLPILGAHWGILWFRGVKNFGERYQKANTILKIQITLYAFKIKAIHDNTLLAPANGQKPPKSNWSLRLQRWVKVSKSNLSSGTNDV